MKCLVILMLVGYTLASDCKCSFSYPQPDSSESSSGSSVSDADLEVIKGAKDTLDYLTDAVYDLKGKRCPKGFVECLDTGNCIVGLKVCDKINDCRDRSDESEAVCKRPFDIGDEFVGFLHYANDCNYGVETEVDLTITLIEEKSFFPQRPRVKARVKYSYVEDGSKKSGSYSVSGNYNPASGVLNLSQPDGEEYPGIIGRFGATRNDQFQADFKLYHKRENCGSSVFKKQ